MNGNAFDKHVDNKNTSCYKQNSSFQIDVSSRNNTSNNNLPVHYAANRLYTQAQFHQYYTLQTLLVLQTRFWGQGEENCRL